MQPSPSKKDYWEKHSGLISRTMKGNAVLIKNTEIWPEPSVISKLCLGQLCLGHGGAGLPWHVNCALSNFSVAHYIGNEKAMVPHYIGNENGFNNNSNKHKLHLLWSNRSNNELNVWIRQFWLICVNILLMDDDTQKQNMTSMNNVVADSILYQQLLSLYVSVVITQSPYQENNSVEIPENLKVCIILDTVESKKLFLRIFCIILQGTTFEFEWNLQL